jgi:signal transduction histidine kinase
MQGTSKPPARSVPEALTRFLRHEIGDLLQTVYASVAILQRRLPDDWMSERRILSDLRARAENCKDLLDTVHDFIVPLTLSCERIDPGQVAAELVRTAAGKSQQLQIKAESGPPIEIEADPRRLTRVGHDLLENACAAARGHVWFRTAPGSLPGSVEWTVTDDGPGVPADRMEQLFRPFCSTRHGHPGLGLPTAQKLVALHGGQITAENIPAGGFRVRVVWPAAPPGEESRQEPK